MPKAQDTAGTPQTDPAADLDRALAGGFHPPGHLGWRPVRASQTMMELVRSLYARFPCFPQPRDEQSPDGLLAAVPSAGFVREGGLDLPPEVFEGIFPKSADLGLLLEDETTFLYVGYPGAAANGAAAPATVFRWPGGRAFYNDPRNAAAKDALLALMNQPAADRGPVDPASDGHAEEEPEPARAPVSEEAESPAQATPLAITKPEPSAKSAPPPRKSAVARLRAAGFAPMGTPEGPAFVLEVEGRYLRIMDADRRSLARAQRYEIAILEASPSEVAAQPESDQVEIFDDIEQALAFIEEQKNAPSPSL